MKKKAFLIINMILNFSFLGGLIFFPQFIFVYACLAVLIFFLTIYLFYNDGQDRSVPHTMSNTDTNTSLKINNADKSQLGLNSSSNVLYIKDGEPIYDGVFNHAPSQLQYEMIEFWNNISEGMGGVMDIIANRNTTNE